MNIYIWRKSDWFIKTRCKILHYSKNQSRKMKKKKKKKKHQEIERNFRLKEKLHNKENTDNSQARKK